MNRASLFLIIFSATMLIVISNAVTLNIASYNQYGGYYWGYVSSASQGNCASCWSVGVNTGNSAYSPSGSLNEHFVWYWGDGSTSELGISTGATALNSYSGTVGINDVSYSVSSGQLTNYPYTTQGAVSGASSTCTSGMNDASTSFSSSTNGNGNVVFQMTHEYSSPGIYSVYIDGVCSQSYVSPTISVAIISPPPSISISVPINQIDIGHSYTIDESANCGSSTYCPATTPTSGINLLSSPYSNSFSFPVTSSGVGTWGGSGGSIYIYNPVSTNDIYSNQVSIYQYPDIASPTISFSQSPATISGSYVIGEPITANVEVPVQYAGSTAEGAPSGTLTWGDGTQSTLSFSQSGSNWVATPTHTYNSPNSGYSVGVSLESYNYVTYGSSYGSTSSNSANIDINPYVYPVLTAIIPPSSNACGGSVNGIYATKSGSYEFELSTGSYPINHITVTNWGDGNSNTYSVGSTTTQSHTYSSSGSDTIQATVYDSNGKTASNSVGISVLAFTNPSISVSPQSATATQSHSFSATVSAGTCPLNSLTWVWGDGTSTSTSASAGTDTSTHTYQMNSLSGSGTETNQYTLQDTVTDNSGDISSSSATMSISYTYPSVGSVTPTSVFNSPLSSSYTPTFSVSLTSGTSPLSSISWNFGDGTSNPSTSAISGTNTMQHAYSSANTYSITPTATDINNYYSSTATSETVNSYVYPSIGSLTNTFPNNGTITTTILSGISYNYTVPLTTGSFALNRIVWVFSNSTDSDINTISNSAVSGNNTIQQSLISAGNYTLTVQAIDIYGVTSTKAYSITIQPYNPPVISNFTIYPISNINPTRTLVNGIPITFSVNLTQGDYGIVSLNWNFGDGVQTLINSTTSPALNSTGINYMTHTYSSAGTYTMTLTATDNQTFSSQQNEIINITQYANPSLSNFNPTKVIVNTTNAYSVTEVEGSFPINSTIFDFNGVNVSVSTVPSVGGIGSVNYKFTSAGTYPVTIYAYDIYGNSTTLSSDVYSQALPDITYFNTVSYNGSLFSIINTTFMVNISEGSNPLANLTFYYGDGTNQFVNLNDQSQVSLLLNDTYSSGTYVAYFTVTDSNGNQETSNKLTFTVSQYKYPQVVNITPTSVFDVVSNQFTFNVSVGSFNVSELLIDWGDNSANTTVSSIPNAVNGTILINASHIYVLGANATYTIIAEPVDTNNLATAFGQNVNTAYQLPAINSVSPISTYATVPTSFTFNITQGTFNISGITVNFGNSNIVTQSINTTNPSINNTYSTAGTYTLSATAIDVNNQPSSEFLQTITVNPYIPPFISQLTPTSVTAGLNVTYSVQAQAGTFPLGNLSINWGDGQTINYTNMTNGTNNINFEYLSNNSFTVVEKQYDSFGIFSQNTTLINVLGAPYTFTTPQQVINYTITNTTTSPIYVQLNTTFLGNATLPTNYTVQQDNFINSYVCNTFISNAGLFGVQCNINPNAITFQPEILYATVYSEDTAGVIKAVTETININTIITPTPIALPFNQNLSVSTPPLTTQYSEINPYVIIFLMGMLIMIGSAIVYIIKR